ncbi:Cytochrome bc1 complex Rieske iron-sulfur subunit [Nocardioides aquaticus]|uniref:Cytochrome bc1 complex Rieske iron-sulfur subunit n=1 Tax=Nocardioides aquaticus TaxID=160826 RepID=A0ABX8EF66_9ACTN|nr:Cytochrome bc1 complex Rieske iron-sulfur subunit [Nocardioides aquaticus]
MTPDDPKDPSGQHPTVPGTTPGASPQGGVVPDSHGEFTPVRTDTPVADPGLPAHQWRPTDVDPKLEKRAERQVAGMFVAAQVFVVLFVVSYFVFDIGGDGDAFLGLGASTVTLGLCLGIALLLIGVGIIQWARKLMGDHEISEMRHPARSSDEDREATLEALRVGTEESGIARRPLIRNTLLGSVGLLGVPAVVLLRDLGPTPGQVATEQPYEGAGLANTVWADGMRVVRDVIGTPIRAADLEIGDLVNATAAALYETDEEGELVLEGTVRLIANSKAPVIVVRMEPEEIEAVEGRENWTVEGIIAYSKICTHVGCPISLYERTTHHVLCPCHQSTFDLADGANVIFGPAARPLPQLALAVDDEGYLVAQSDFDEPVGPSFWERG